MTAWCAFGSWDWIFCCVVGGEWSWVGRAYHRRLCAAGRYVDHQMGMLPPPFVHRVRSTQDLLLLSTTTTTTTTLALIFIYTALSICLPLLFICFLVPANTRRLSYWSVNRAPQSPKRSSIRHFAISHPESSSAILLVQGLIGLTSRAFFQSSYLSNLCRTAALQGSLIFCEKKKTQ